MIATGVQRKGGWLAGLLFLWAVITPVAGGEPVFHSLSFKNTPDLEEFGWVRSGHAGDMIVGDGVLRMESDLPGGNAYSLTGGEGDPLWDGSRPSTIRFRVRVVENIETSPAAHVSVSDEFWLYLIPIRETELQEYVLLIDGDGFSRLFVDGVEVGGVSRRPLGTAPPHTLRFGDIGSQAGGVTEWSEFSWTSEGAFEPGQ